MSPHTEHFRQAFFGSAPWISAWRAAWGDTKCLAPLPATGIYRARSTIKKFLPITLAAPLGVSTSAIPSLRSEYLFFAQQPDNSAQAITEFLRDAQSQRWDQLWLPDIPKNSNELPLLKVAVQPLGWELVEQNNSTAYSVNTRSGDFAEYLQHLGKNSRLQLFNRRKNFEKLGTISLINCWPNFNYFLDVINEFHQQRWQKPLYTGRNKQFIEALLPALVDAGHSVDLSLLCLNEKPVAAVLDLHINGRVYNLQSGFSENIDSKISLGTLHFGYKIEAAFNNPQLHAYDFMAGIGRAADYKKQFATDSMQLVTVTLIRSPWLKLLSRCYKTVYKPMRAWLRKPEATVAPKAHGE